jgi:hypothetical protein
VNMAQVSDERLEQLLNEATVLARQAAVDVQRCATVSARQVNQSRLDHHECVASIYRELRERREAERWIPVSEKMPDCMYVLMAGRSSSGTDWRDVGVYRGDGDFVDKYGSGSHPTHWRPLPAAPEVKP